MGFIVLYDSSLKLVANLDRFPSAPVDWMPYTCSPAWKWFILAIRPYLVFIDSLPTFSCMHTTSFMNMEHCWTLSFVLRISPRKHSNSISPRSLRLPSRTITRCSFRVLLKRSTMPSDCGYKGVVPVFRFRIEIELKLEIRSFAPD